MVSTILYRETMQGKSFRKIDFFKEKNDLSKEEIVSFNNNRVIVRLSKGDGYSFHYFSDYDVEVVFEKDSNKNSILNLVIKEK